MAYSTQKLHPVFVPSLQPITRPSLQIRAQSRRDDGISGRLVDANLRILRERIKVVKIKNKLEACCKSEMGWNFSVRCAKKPKIYEELYFFIQLFGWAIGSFGFIIASGSLCLSLISLLVYFSQ